MAKPSLEATRFATDETNNTAPSSGARDTGWEPSQLAISSYFNALQKANYDWFAYIDAGEWDDDLHVTGDVEVDGDTTLDGNATVGGTLDVTGDSTFDADVDVAGDVTLAADKNVVLQDEGHLLTGERNAFVPLVASLAQVSSGVVSTSYGTVGAIVDTGAVCRIPLLLDLDQFQTITEVVVVGSSTSGALLELEYGGTSFSSAGGFSAGGTGPFWAMSGTDFLNTAPLWVKVTNLGSTTTLQYAIVKYEARP